VAHASHVGLLESLVVEVVNHATSADAVMLVAGLADSVHGCKKITDWMLDKFDDQSIYIGGNYANIQRLEKQVQGLGERFESMRNRLESVMRPRRNSQSC